MSLTYFENEDVVVTISDAAQSRLAADQRMDGVVGTYTAIVIGSGVGLVCCSAAFVILRIFSS